MSLDDASRALLARFGYVLDPDELWAFAPEKGHKVPVATALRWAAADAGVAILTEGAMPSSDLPPWELVAMHDPAGRRGVWYREIPATTADPLTPRVVEVCAGRVGEDDYVRLVAGAVLTPADLRRLAGCLRTGAMVAIDSNVQAPMPNRRQGRP